MSGFLSPDPRLRELSDLGLVQAGALLHTYVSGTPSTPLTTYSDVALTIPNANPIVASAGGLFGPIYLVPGTAYKYVLTDALGNALWSQEPVGGPSTGLTAPVLVTQGGTGIIVGVAGGIPYFSTTTAIASSLLLTAHGVMIGGGAAAAPLTTAVGLTGQVLTGVTGADPTFQTPTPALTLLKAGSGTDNAAGATNVDTIAITGLTAKDLLLVKIEAISVAQATANIGLYNATDGVAINTAVASLAAAAVLMMNFDVAQSQAAATTIWARAEGKDTVPTVYGAIIVSTFTQNWTGAWTLALRHGGVTAGGSLQWRWSVYKLAGQ